MYVKVEDLHKRDPNTPEGVASKIAGRLSSIESEIVAAIRDAQFAEMRRCATDICSGCQTADRPNSWLSEAKTFDHFDEYVHIDTASNQMWMKCEASAIWRRYNRIINPVVVNTDNGGIGSTIPGVDPTDWFNLGRMCNACSGTGVCRSINGPCRICNGLGYIENNVGVKG